jgi:hypothetical protein
MAMRRCEYADVTYDSMEMQSVSHFNPSRVTTHDDRVESAVR